MPSPVATRLLYEDTPNDAQCEMATWSVSANNRRPSKRRWRGTIIALIFMLLIGIILGGVLHALAFPQGGSILNLISDDSSLDVNSTASDIINGLDSSENSSSEEKDKKTDSSSSEESDKKEGKDNDNEDESDEAKESDSDEKKTSKESDGENDIDSDEKEDSDSDEKKDSDSDEKKDSDSDEKKDSDSEEKKDSEDDKNESDEKKSKKSKKDDSDSKETESYENNDDDDNEQKSGKKSNKSKESEESKDSDESEEVKKTDIKHQEKNNNKYGKEDDANDETDESRKDKENEGKKKDDKKKDEKNVRKKGKEEEEEDDDDDDDKATVDVMNDEKDDNNNDKNTEKKELINDEDDDEEAANTTFKCKDFPWTDARLPDYIRPISYNLTIHPNITTNILLGSVAMDLKILSKTKLIVLHADRLDMSTFSIKVNGKKAEAEFSECSSRSMWAFELSDTLTMKDEVDMEIDFEGKVMPDLHGLYISTHVKADGNKSSSAVTQFEPSYARKMFPCFDEPNFKATFELAVVRSANHIVRSNMNLKVSREHADGLYLDVFHKSVKMSTYLLAIAVLENYNYAKKSTRHTEEIIEVRLYAPSDVLKNQSDFGLTTAVKGLEYFEDYFNISYPLEKMDLLAVDDFSEGAMENWGLVTFRDSALLHSEEFSSALAKEQIALIMCHEIAHQWFGNLVTMDWWNDLWLNEGFANYMEYRCVDHIFPDWNIMTRFYAENAAFSQEGDGLKSSRAISSPTQNNTNIMSLFDAISYHKAASIINMIEGLAGVRNFQRALIEYLKKYAYGNAQGVQLWKIVEKHAQLPDGITVESLATAFISQIGYPYVRVSLDNNQVTVYNQTRFFFDDNEEDNLSSWPIPVHFRTESEEEIKLKVLRTVDNQVSWTLLEPASWIIANTGGLGYYKVLYDEDIYESLAKQLKHKHSEISAIDRSMILTDAFDFSKTSLLNISTYMNLLEYAENEEDRMAWMLINKQLKMIEVWIEGAEFANLFKDLERSLVLKSYGKLGWKNDVGRTPAQKGLQVEILQIACRLKHRDCTKKAMSLYNDWNNKTKNRPAPELLGIVLEEGIRQGGETAWDKALIAYTQASHPYERQQLIGALTSTHDPALISRLLRLCLESVVIRANVVPRILAALSHNEVARVHTWRFFRINYNKFTKLLGENTSLLMNSIRCMVERLSTEEDLQELKTFLDEKKLEWSKAKLDQMFEQIQLNIQWRQLNEAELGKWLHNWDDRRRSIQRKRKHVRHAFHI